MQIGDVLAPKMGAVASKLAERVYKTTPVPAPRPILPLTPHTTVCKSWMILAKMQTILCVALRVEK